MIIPSSLPLNVYCMDIMIHSSWEYYASNGSMVQKLLLGLGKLLVGQAGGGDRERRGGIREKQKQRESETRQTSYVGHYEVFKSLHPGLVSTRMSTFDTFLGASVKSDLSRYIMKT